MIYSKGPVPGRRYRIDLAKDDQVCGICHEAPEDKVVSYHSCSLLHRHHPVSKKYFLFSLLFQVACCKHVFCKTCLQSLAPALGLALCPLCSTPFTGKSAMKKNDSSFTGKSAMKKNDSVLKNNTGSGTTFKDFKSSSLLKRISLNEFQTSTKIEALVCPIYNNLFPVLDLQLKFFLIIYRRSTIVKGKICKSIFC